MKSISPQQELDQWPSTMLQYSCPSSPSSSPRTPPPTSSSCCPTRRPGCCWSTPPSPSRRRPQCPHQGGLVAWSWKGSWTRPAPFPWWSTSSAVEYREPCVADIITAVESLAYSFHILTKFPVVLSLRTNVHNVIYDLSHSDRWRHSENYALYLKHGNVFGYSSVVK